MTKYAVRLSLLLVFLILGSSPLQAQEKERPVKSRAGLDYIGILGSAVHLRKVANTDEDSEGWLSAGTLVLGTNISDLFHAELRAGGGITSGEVTDDLTIDIDYFASWYMGMHYNVASFSNVYAQLGFSYINGSADLQNEGLNANRPYRDIEGDFPGSSFAFSYLAGIDLNLAENTYLVLEAGRLFEDTDSSAMGYQFNGGLRYEF
ncbi:outer membrane beta-barrel protein [Marinobacter sp. 1Y8]